MKKYILYAFLSISLFFSFNVSYSFATELNPGANIVSDQLANNKGEKNDAYENLSDAHKEQSKENKKESGDVSKAEASSWLQSHNKWVQFASFMTWLGHQIAWFGIKGLYFFSSMVESALMSILSFISKLFGGGLVNEILAGFPGGASALAWTILGTAIAIFGVKYMLKGEKLELKNTLVNVIMIAVFLVSSSVIIDKFVDAGLGTFESARSSVVGGKKGSFSLQIIKDNVVDLQKAIDKNDNNALSNNNSKGLNNITDDFLKSADMAQVLKPKDKDKKIAKYLEYEIVDVNDKGQIITDKIDNGWFSIFKAGYFRFGTQFFSIYIGEIIMCVAFALYAYLMLRNAIDLIFTKLIGGIAAAMDIEKGTKLKTVIMEIAKSAMGFGFTGISLCIFMRLFTYINSQNWNVVAQAIALVAATIACLDGAKIFDRLFGIDLGLRSGVEATMGAFAGAKMATSVVSGAGKAVAGGASAIYNGGQAIKNGVMESIDNHKDQDSQQNTDHINDTNNSNNKDIGPSLSQQDVQSHQNQDHQDNHQVQNDLQHEAGDNELETHSNDKQDQEMLENSDYQVADTNGAVSSDAVDMDGVEAGVDGDLENVDDDANVSLEDNDTSSLDANNLETNSAIDSGTVDASSEDNDMNSLNESLTESAINDNTMTEQADINQESNDYSNGVVDSSGAIENDSAASELSSDIEGLEAKVNDTYTPQDNVDNGVGLQTNASNNDSLSSFEGANGLSSQYEGEHLDSTDYQSLGLQGNDALNPSNMSRDTYNSSVKQNTQNYQSSHLQDNSSSQMSQLSQQSHLYQSGHLGVQNRTTSQFDPTRRMNRSTDHPIHMPEIHTENVQTGGAKAPFDHTEE